MTTWYVHRRGDGSIASAHSEKQPGYATEAVDDVANAELRALLAPPEAVAELTVADLAASLVAKGVLDFADLPVGTQAQVAAAVAAGPARPR